MLNALSFITLRWLDVLDILLVAVLMYQLYKLVKGTVAIRIFLGILAIYLLWKLVEALQMELLGEILGQFIGVGVIALLIVFQQELRRFLLLIGTTGFFTRRKTSKWFSSLKWQKKQQADNIDMDAIVLACKKMSKTYTGALIVIARDSELKYYSSTGELINARLSATLLESIFFKNSPLHDGGVIIANGKIVAARCVLPVSESDKFPAYLGLRHRAAVGITENTGAISIVVSEETGKISLCFNGKMENMEDAKELKKRLKEVFE